MSRPWQKRFLLAFGLLAFVAAIERYCVLLWVGFTDVEVEYVITDAETGRPVEGIRIIVERDEENPMTVGPTDTNGVATDLSRNHIVAGETGMLFGTEWGYSVNSGGYQWRVEADGYEPRPWEWPGRSGRWIEHVGPRRAKLVVPIALRRVSP